MIPEIKCAGGNTSRKKKKNVMNLERKMLKKIRNIYYMISLIKMLK